MYKKAMNIMLFCITPVTYYSSVNEIYVVAHSGWFTGESSDLIVT